MIASELMPQGGRRLGMKVEVAANRCHPSLDKLVYRALAALDALLPEERLRLTGLASSKFEWLPSYVG